MNHERNQIMAQIIYSSESEGYDPRCPACGEPIDYCRGHGEIGDPTGALVLKLHDLDEHMMCDARGCTERDEAKVQAAYDRLNAFVFDPNLVVVQLGGEQ